MYVVKGKILTLMGEIPVEKLKIDDLIVDRAGSTRRLLSITKGKVDSVLHFQNNTLVVSADSVVYTDKGAMKVTESTTLNVRKENNSTTTERVRVVAEDTCGYSLEIEGGLDFFVNGYNFQNGGAIND